VAEEGSSKKIWIILGIVILCVMVIVGVTVVIATNAQDDGVVTAEDCGEYFYFWSGYCAHDTCPPPS